MRNINLLSAFLLLLSSAYGSSFKEDALKRMSLMSYASYSEVQSPYDLKWDSLTSSYFSFLPVAHAYQEGDPCLILGFKSTFKNGMCRLSLSVDAKKYKRSCAKGLYACNPQVFGSKNDKPFCISASLGNELSKYCSHKSLSSIASAVESKNFSAKTREVLKRVTKTSPQNFSFEMTLDLTKDDGFNKALTSLFKEPLTMKKSEEYTSSLCSSIQSSKSSRTFKLDLENCKQQLQILSGASIDKKEVSNFVIQNDKGLEKEPLKKAHVSLETEDLVTNIVTTSELNLNLPKKECVEKIDKTQAVKNIEDLAKVTENLDAQVYMKCINELYYNEDLPTEARGNYFHKVGGQINFAKQCWKLDNHGENEIIYSFVSEDGFKMIKYPVYKYFMTIGSNQVENSHPRNLLKFYDGDSPYYISQIDNIGQYFDSFPTNQLKGFASENDFMQSPASLISKYIKPYDKLLEKNNSGKRVRLSSPEEVGLTTESAKSCIKERLKDYVTIMMFRSHSEVFPYTNELNADLQTSPRSKLRDKYIRTSDEIKSSLENKIFKQSSACRAVISEKDFSDSFGKAFGSRIDNYNKYRKYFIESD
jgi:hypothetical protein